MGINEATTKKNVSLCSLSEGDKPANVAEYFACGDSDVFIAIMKFQIPGPASCESGISRLVASVLTTPQLVPGC
jgi:hypothetical protein